MSPNSIYSNDLTNILVTSIYIKLPKIKIPIKNFKKITRNWEELIWWSEEIINLSVPFIYLFSFITKIDLNPLATTKKLKDWQFSIKSLKIVD